MSVQTCKHGEDFGQIPLRYEPLFRGIVQNRSPGDEEEFLILSGGVKCMPEGEGVTRLQYTKTVRGLRLHSWERAGERENEAFADFDRGSLPESQLEQH